MRRLQVLSTFSRLRELEDIKQLMLSDQEDYERNWV